MRITAYSERLLQGLKTLDWPQPLKDAQEYWIGKSQGAEVNFGLENSDVQIKVFTTRPDTVLVLLLWYWHQKVHWYRR